MKFSAAIVLAAAMGAAAHPSHRAHRNAHRSADGRVFVMNQKPAPPAPTTTDAAPPPPAATSSVAPAPSPAPPVANAAAAVGSSASSSSSKPSSSSSVKSGYKAFCNKKRATDAQNAYVGNTGASQGGQYGCNIMEISADAVDLYDYTMKFTNQGSGEQSCVCWNKIGPDGGMNGFFSNNQAISFKVAGNGEAHVAFDTNSQVGCSCGSGSVPLTSFGQFAGTWVEADFGNASNGGWSGFDASCLAAAKYGLQIPGLEVCGKGTCSTVHAGGSGVNAYLGGMEAEDGVGGNVAPGPLALTVKINTN